MTDLALDTNAYRALDDGNEDVKRLLQQTQQVGVSTVVLSELWYGIFDGSRAEYNTSRLRRFLANERVVVLLPDEKTARLFGEISAELKQRGVRIQHNDIWIAALCKQYDYALVTRDKGFAHVTGLEVVSF